MLRENDLDIPYDSIFNTKLKLSKMELIAK